MQSQKNKHIRLNLLLKNSQQRPKIKNRINHQKLLIKPPTKEITHKAHRQTTSIPINGRRLTSQKLLIIKQPHKIKNDNKYPKLIRLKINGKRSQ